MQRSPHLLKSFTFAIEGIILAFKYNRNIRIHFVLALIAFGLCYFLYLSWFETSVICVVITLVICAEMINTALEEVVNLVTNEHKKEAKIAKDVSAGMVLISAICSVFVAIFIFVPHIFQLITK